MEAIVVEELENRPEVLKENYGVELDDIQSACSEIESEKNDNSEVNFGQIQSSDGKFLNFVILPLALLAQL